MLADDCVGKKLEAVLFVDLYTNCRIGLPPIQVVSTWRLWMYFGSSEPSAVLELRGGETFNLQDSQFLAIFLTACFAIPRISLTSARPGKFMVVPIFSWPKLRWNFRRSHYDDSAKWKSWGPQFFRKYCFSINCSRSTSNMSQVSFREISKLFSIKS